ncbi:hypothetical protein [Aeromonas salmonicida]
MKRFTHDADLRGMVVLRSLGFQLVPFKLHRFRKQRRLIPKIVRLLYKYALKYPRLIIFLNEDDRNEFVSRRIIDSRKARIFPGEGVDLDFFYPVINPSEDDSIHFLLIARLLWDKGVGEYVAAAKYVRSVYP